MRRVALSALPTCIGEELGVSAWHVIDQDRVDRFADATGDDQWIHVDVARSAPLGGTLAHGYLLLSLIPVLRREVFVLTGVSRTVNYGLNKVRFITPVMVGMSVRLRVMLHSCVPRGEGSQVTYNVTMELGEGAAVKPACIAEIIVVEYPDNV